MESDYHYLINLKPLKLEIELSSSKSTDNKDAHNKNSSQNLQIVSPTQQSNYQNNINPENSKLHYNLLTLIFNLIEVISFENPIISNMFFAKKIMS